MDTEKIFDWILEFQENDPSNRIPAEIAKSPEYIGKKIYEGALLAVAAVDDPIIVSLKNNKDANIDLMQPEEWLPGAKSVISVFQSYAKWIVEENTGGEMPSEGWLHARIEGQAENDKMSKKLSEEIQMNGNEVVAPAIDPRMKIYGEAKDNNTPEYTSNWSERHVAYAAGLGTFGLSRGLITELGTTGRLMSIITTLPLTPTKRTYEGLYDYCSKCGACARACPQEAISVEHFKDHAKCNVLIEKTRQMWAPYYGCGKCQCGMPCSSGIPGKR